LENRHLRVTTNLLKGTFDVVSAGAERPAVWEIASSFSVVDGGVLSSLDSGFEFVDAGAIEDAHGPGLEMRVRRAGADGLELTASIAMYEEVPFALASLELRNDTSDAVRVAWFRPLDAGRVDLGTPARGWRFYKEGWQNWSPALVLACSGEDINVSPPIVAPATRPPQREGRFVSELVTAVVDPATNLGVVAGFVSTADQFSQVWLDRDDGTLTAASYADGIEVPAGGRLASERLAIGLTSSPVAALPLFGDVLAREAHATLWPQPVSGWCSWYCFWQGVSEKDIIANLDFLAANRGELPVDYVQVDDGYQASIGDWLTPNEKFPHGMGWVANQIREAGFKAGLWLAPFLIGADSRLWKDHPEWAVQYTPGRPYVAMINWNQNCYALDLTRADVMAWLEQVFRTVFDEWGYDYVKIDFTYAGAVDGIRADPNVTRAQAYRRALEMIRQVAGDRFILGCGNPIGPSIGVVNASRIGPDVAPFWHPQVTGDLSAVSTFNAIRNVISRYWMHQRLWLNDPDCLMVRDSDTSLTPEEIRTLATVVAMSGGMVLNSDSLPQLIDERRDIVSMMLPVYGRAAAPLDLFESEIPQVLDLGCGSHRMVALFNWADEAVDVRMPISYEETALAFDVWERRFVADSGNDRAFHLPAHGCKLLAVRDKMSRPQVVGSSFHLLQGACEIEAEQWDGNALRVTLAPVARKEGALYVRVPSSFGPPVNDGMGIEQISDEIWAVRLKLTDRHELRLTFGEAR